MRIPIALAAAAGLATVSLVCAAATSTEEAVFVMHKIDTTGIGAPIGEVTMRDSPEGLVLQPNLHDLPPGPHGFHFHEKADCRPSVKDGKKLAAGMSGEHFDPEKTGKHLGPTGSGHKGDLPVLRVDNDGTVDAPLTAPRLKVSEIRNLALVIHVDGDNYSDAPKALGGGGDRIACGVLQKSQTRLN